MKGSEDKTLENIHARGQETEETTNNERCSWEEESKGSGSRWPVGSHAVETSGKGGPQVPGQGSSRRGQDVHSQPSTNCFPSWTRLVEAPRASLTAF